MNVQVIRTMDGTYIGQACMDYSVEGNTRPVYESPEYVTEGMAVADAKCWIAFNEKDEPVETEQDETFYDVCEGDTVNYRGTILTAQKFAEFVSGEMGPNTTYRVQPISKKVFQIFIKNGSTPTRKFTITKK